MLIFDSPTDLVDRPRRRVVSLPALTELLPCGVADVHYRQGSTGGRDGQSAIILGTPEHIGESEGSFEIRGDAGVVGYLVGSQLHHRNAISMS